MGPAYLDLALGLVGLGGPLGLHRTPHTLHLLPAPPQDTPSCQLSTLTNLTASHGMRPGSVLVRWCVRLCGYLRSSPSVCCTACIWASRDDTRASASFSCDCNNIHHANSLAHATIQARPRNRARLQPHESAAKRVCLRGLPWQRQAGTADACCRPVAPQRGWPQCPSQTSAP